MRPAAALLPAVLVAVLASCATQEPPPAVAVPTPAAPAPRAGAKAPADGEPKLSRAARERLASRNLKPIVTRPLNARADCRFRDELGYGGTLDLDVAEAEVRRFDARIDIPKRGVCRFALADFRQSASAPTVTLASRRTRCTVNLWEQAEQLTVAFHDCRAECSGKSADYLWPILVDNRNGSCS